MTGRRPLSTTGARRGRRRGRRGRLCDGDARVAWCAQRAISTAVRRARVKRAAGPRATARAQTAARLRIQRRASPRRRAAAPPRRRPWPRGHAPRGRARAHAGDARRQAAARRARGSGGKRAIATRRDGRQGAGGRAAARRAAARARRAAARRVAPRAARRGARADAAAAQHGRAARVGRGARAAAGAHAGGRRADRRRLRAAGRRARVGPRRAAGRRRRQGRRGRRRGRGGGRGRAFGGDLCRRQGEDLREGGAVCGGRRQERGGSRGAGLAGGLVRDELSQIDAESLCAAVVQHRFEHAVVAFGGERRVVVSHLDEQPSLADIMQWQLTSTGKKKNLSFTRREPLQASLFLPLHLCDPKLASQEPASRSMQLSGCMHFEAVVMQDASIGTVLRAVRHDLYNSIRARLLLLHEADEEEQIEPDEHQTASSPAPASRALPCRVMAAPLQSAPPSVPYCDYLVSGETVQDDVSDRIAEVLSWDHTHLKNVCIEAVEQPPTLDTAVKSVTFDDAPQEDDPSPMMELDAAESAPSAVLTTGIIAAVVIAVIAIILKEIVWVYF
ncbi:plectin [Gracilaria domingensis]|nr:plectin [Gracilaria domingensis]